jgi:hypothetical protein
MATTDYTDFQGFMLEMYELSRRFKLPDIVGMYNNLDFAPGFFMSTESGDTKHSQWHFPAFGELFH